MTTLMLLLARHDMQETLPLRAVSEDYFEMKPDAFERKIKQGKIDLGLPTDEIRFLKTRGVPLTVLARYIDARREKAVDALAEYSCSAQDEKRQDTTPDDQTKVIFSAPEAL